MPRRSPAAGASPSATSRLAGNCGAAAGAISAGANSSAIVITGAGGVVALGLMDPLLLAAFAAALPAGVLLTRRFVGQTTSFSTEYLAVYAAIASRLADALTGIRTIRAAGTAGREVERVLVPMPGLARYGHATWMAYARAAWQGDLLVPAVQLPVVAVVGFAVAAGHGPHSEPVVRDLSLRIPENDHLVIAGASGIGKSTLALLIAGLERPQHGTVLLGGVPLDAVDPRRARQLIALIGWAPTRSSGCPGPATPTWRACGPRPCRTTRNRARRCRTRTRRAGRHRTWRRRAETCGAARYRPGTRRAGRYWAGRGRGPAGRIAGPGGTGGRLSYQPAGPGQGPGRDQAGALWLRFGYPGPSR